MTGGSGWRSWPGTARSARTWTASAATSRASCGAYAPLFLEGDINKAEYDRDKRELQAQLDALQVPAQPALEQAGETLETLGAEWANAPRRYQHEMLTVIFEAICVDVAARKLISVKPHPQFAPLFRMDGLEEENGNFYYREEA